MRTILYINNELCRDLTQLQECIRDISYGSEVYTDIIEYALCGDLTAWLHEHGQKDIANQVDAIDKTIGDTEFINILVDLLLGEASSNTPKPNIIKKPNYSCCFSCDISIPSMNNKEVVVLLSIIPKTCINENYGIKVATGWGTKSYMFNPYQHEDGKEEKVSISFQNQFHKDIDKVVVTIENEKIFEEDIKNLSVKNSTSVRVDSIDNSNHKNLMRFKGHNSPMFAVVDSKSQVYLYDNKGEKMEHETLRWFHYEREENVNKKIVLVTDEKFENLYFITKEGRFFICNLKSACFASNDITNIKGCKKKVYVRYPCICIEELITYEIRGKFDGLLVTRYANKKGYFKYVAGQLLSATETEWKGLYSNINYGKYPQRRDPHRRPFYNHPIVWTQNGESLEFEFIAQRGNKRNGSHLRYRDKSGLLHEIFSCEKRIKYIEMLANRLIWMQFAMGDTECVIDLKGKVIIAEGKYQNIDVVSDKYMAVTKPHGWYSQISNKSMGDCGIVDIQGREIIPPCYEDIAIIDY